MTEQSPAKTKLATLVNVQIGPAIKSFVESLTDDELLELLKDFKTMNIDIAKTLTEQAKERKIQSKQWTGDSPFDAIMESGLNNNQ